jgi:hypothetical protein
MKRINWERKQILNKFEEARGDPEYVKHLEEHLVKKYGYKPPKPYHEMMRKPAPNDLPKAIAQRLNNNNTRVDDELI